MHILTSLHGAPMLQDSLLTYQSPIVRAGQIDMMVNTVSRKDNFTSGLSDLKNRSEKATGRGQILTILKANSRSIARKSGEICTVQTLLQPISFKPDRLPEGIFA